MLLLSLANDTISNLKAMVFIITDVICSNKEVKDLPPHFPKEIEVGVWSIPPKKIGGDVVNLSNKRRRGYRGRVAYLCVCKSKKHYNEMQMQEQQLSILSLIFESRF